jgi:septum formation protein
VSVAAAVGEGRSRFVLASGSPQRRAILERLGVKLTVRVPGVEELAHGDPAAVALENAGRKARAAWRGDGAETLIACDTVVALGQELYGKPADEGAARRTLEALGGATHEVVSGLVVLNAPAAGAGAQSAGDPEEQTALERTQVTFGPLQGARLDWYLATGEWRGRAGGYAIQGAGAALVRSVSGEYENVVGLPLSRLLELCPGLLPG